MHKCIHRKAFSKLLSKGAYVGMCLSQDWDRQNPSQIITELCGFITILSGTFLLHSTKDMGDNMTSGLSLC